ncbi:hypothetical protein DYB32_004930 [Aphanomyces invadans]|uniref:LMBR1 domain-containing protein 2 n=1 Tax=Aphanomyces invadans TaxID=157072 RepID=A0A418AZ00_9STRA|nr:hypothetical protein DYB32_004930 [Aphanomyces invadans]
MLFLFTGALLHYYKDPHVGYLVYSFVFMSWYAGFLGLLMLPVDISATLAARIGASSQPLHVHTSLLTGWKVLYWLTFVFSWVVLPVLIEYSQSGAFTPQQKLHASIRYLLRHYAILLAAGVALVMYLIVVDHLTLSGIVGLAMTVANTYGLLWLIGLLGYGVVNVPRNVWRTANPHDRLRRIYFRAIQIHDDRVEAMFTYDDVIRDVQDLMRRFQAIEQSTIILTPDMQHIKQCLRHVAATLGHDGGVADDDLETGSSKRASRRSKHALRPPSSSSKMLVLEDTSLPSEADVILLHGRVKRILADLRRCEQAWQDVCWSAQRLIQWIDQTEQLHASGAPTPSTTRPMSVTEWFSSWTAHAMWTYAIGAATACCVFGSAIVLWSEVFMGASPRWSPLGQLLAAAATSSEPPTSGALSVQLVLLALLTYMGTCVYQSLFSIRGFGRVALHGAHNSTELSLLTAAIQQCRLQFSLGYNFCLLLNRHDLTDYASFHTLFTDMRVIHFFGTDFNVYLPMCMVVVAATTMWHGYARLVKSMGLDQYEELMPGHIEHEAKVHQGDVLVQKGIEKYTKMKAKMEKEAAERVGGAKGHGLSQALLDE